MRRRYVADIARLFRRAFAMLSGAITPCCCHFMMPDAADDIAGWYLPLHMLLRRLPWWRHTYIITLFAAMVFIIADITLPMPYTLRHYYISPIAASAFSIHIISYMPLIIGSSAFFWPLVIYILSLYWAYHYYAAWLVISNAITSLSLHIVDFPFHITFHWIIFRFLPAPLHYADVISSAYAVYAATLPLPLAIE